MELIQISLAAARVNANYTVKEASEAFGITEKTLISYEKGRVSPREEVIQKMEKLYNLNRKHFRFPYVEDGEYNDS